MSRSKTMLGAALVLSLAAPTRAEVVDVFVFDDEFSINRPGMGPVVDATINVGDTIRWVWVEGFHDTTAAAGQAETWASPTTSQVGFTFSHTFTNVGSFNYYCTEHGEDLGGGQVKGMAGSITVLSAGCPVDLNGDMQVTIADFLEFLNLFSTGDARAEFDGMPGITVGDFLAFLNAYAAGC